MEDKLVNRYRYAFSNGHIISIDEVTEDSRKSSKYTCIGCGHEMIAALGKVREHYFKHKNHESCSNETYLHELAKRRVKEIFDENENFLIVYKAKNSCAYFNTCPFQGCKKDFNQNIDLKKYFDTCEVEKGCDRFRPDLLLTHSEHPNRKLFIEINVHHPCSEDKLNSGFRIIEIDVNSEHTFIYPFREDFEHIHFFNFIFKRDIIPNKKYKRKCVLVDGNEYKINTNEVYCDKYEEHLENTVIDLILLNEDKENDFQMLVYSKCMERNIIVRNCVFCKEYNFCKRLIFNKKVLDKETGQEKIVEERRSPKECDFNTLWETVEKCNFYKPNIGGCKMFIKEFGEQNFISWENNNQ